MSDHNPSDPQPDPLFLVVLRWALAVVFVMAAVGMLRHEQWRFGRRGYGILITRVQHPVGYWVGPVLALGGAAWLVGGPWVKRWWVSRRRRR